MPEPRPASLLALTGGSGLLALTGGSGMVGSHATEHLAAQGWKLRLGMRGTSSLQWVEHLDFDHRPFQLDNPEGFADFVAGAEVVVHCAAITRAARRRDFLHDNARATAALARAAAAAGVKRFVFVSSLTARGPDGGGGPDSPYGQAKLLAEQELAGVAGDMEVLTVRLGGVYGPRDTDLLPIFQAAKRIGLTAVPPRGGILQPIFSEDAGAAVAAACVCPAFRAPLAVCEQGRYRWEDIASLVRDIAQPSPRVVHLPAIAFNLTARASEAFAWLTRTAPRMDMRRARDLTVNTWTCDGELAQRRLDWQPKVKLPEGLRRTWEWYQEHGWI